MKYLFIKCSIHSVVGNMTRVSPKKWCNVFFWSISVTLIATLKFGFVPTYHYSGGIFIWRVPFGNLEHLLRP